MKFGFRMPSLKKSLKARTTGKLKRAAKKAVNPVYGQKGMGITNPKKSIYNKIYHKTTVGVSDIVHTSSPNQASSQQVYPTYPTVKKPFFQRTWVIVISLIFFAPLGIFLLFRYTGLNKNSKTGISIASAVFFVIAMVSGGTNNQVMPPEVSSIPAIAQSISSSLPSPDLEPTSLSDSESSLSSTPNDELASAVSSSAPAPSSVPETSSTPASSSMSASSAEIATSPNSGGTQENTTIQGGASSDTPSYVPPVTPPSSVQQPSDGNNQVVYWGQSGTKYHRNPNCRSFKGNTPNSGSIDDAIAAGRNGWCGICSK